LYKIFKSVCLDGTPVVIPAPNDCLLADDEEENLTCMGTDEVAEAESVEEEEVVIPPEITALEILEDARNEASNILAAAQQEIEEQKAAAYDDAYRQGYQMGLEQVRQAIDDATARANDIISRAEREAARSLMHAEQQMLELSMAVARKVINRELSETPESILLLVRAALERLSDQDQVTIRVSPDNLETVRKAKPELQSILDRDSTISVSADEVLGSGDCVVDTPFGAVDASVDSQLESLGAALLDNCHE
jgi:flagellar assembly protein FliH